MISTVKTHLNYNLAPNNIFQSERLKKRLSEVKVLKRKDVNVLCSWVVTAPKDLNLKLLDNFFKYTYEFLNNRYGEKNVISAYVHLDEVTPHLHYAFVPVTIDKKKNIEKVSAKEVVNRSDLKSFHQDLENYLKSKEIECNILNEATKDGNKSINELKKQSAMERLNEANENALKIISKAQKQANSIEDNLKPLKLEYEALKAFIDQSIKDSDVSVMYPNYVEISKKGFLHKQEFVTVPKEKWEAKHISANQIEAIKQEREVLEERISMLSKSQPAKKIEMLNNTLDELRKENIKLKNRLKDLKEQGTAMFETLKKHDLVSKIEKILQNMRQAEKVSKKILDRSIER